MNEKKQREAIAEICGYERNYPECLNAMHEAEKVFEGYGMRQSYRRNLLIACDTNDLNEIISASAAQRAEAFLRTINKWEKS